MVEKVHQRRNGDDYVWENSTDLDVELPNIIEKRLDAVVVLRFVKQDKFHV